MRSTQTGNGALLFIGITLIIFFVIFSPFAFIWALNTLFPALKIPFNFYTWLASLLVTGIFAPSRSVKIEK